MRVKKLKSKYLEEVIEEKARMITVTDSEVKITKANKPEMLCLWFGMIYGKDFYIRQGKQVFTNLPVEKQNIKITLNPQAKIILQVGEDAYIIRKTEDIEKDEKIFIFYVLRTCGEYLAVNTDFGNEIAHLFVDHRGLQSIVLQQKMLLHIFLPENNLVSVPEVQREKGEKNE